MKAFLLALTICAGSAHTGDWVGVYAVVDKVVVEPGRLQVWGVFAIADPKLAGKALDLGEGYEAPQRGNLYFTLPAEKREEALKEWAGIAALAGKHEAVGFGLRYFVDKDPVRLRRADEPPKDPDVYQSANGDLPGWNADGIMAVNSGLIAQSYHGAS
jgi:hypothetical protein